MGLSGVFVNLGLYLVMTRGLEVRLEIASPVAIEISILWNFLHNNIWTFRNRRTNGSWVRKFWRFHAVAGLAGIVNYGVFLSLVMMLSLWDILAVLSGIGVGVLVNYSLNSLWTWKEIEVKS